MTNRSDAYGPVRNLAYNELAFAISRALSNGAWHAAYFRTLAVVEETLGGFPIEEELSDGWDD